MCSVTFCSTAAGYLVAMNRDERRSRVAGLPPRRHDLEGVRVIHPEEPGGGTWVSVNDAGIGFALINWYAVTARASEPAHSRGQVILALRDARGFAEAGARLRQLDLSRRNPFRLVAIDPGASRVTEWRWDQNYLTEQRQPWNFGQWLSSGFDEPAAQRIRGEVLRHQLTVPDRGGRDWLRRLHASHAPERGAFSICMHREDAATVSYTEIEVSASEVTMRYFGGAPCASEPGALLETRLARAHPPTTEADRCPSYRPPRAC